MGKISQLSSKYIIHSTIFIDGVVDKPDVVGAIFGQIEGLLGAELELRELQRSGRIGRIEVNLDARNGKTQGSIDIPSSLDKAETAIIGASLEIIQRIGPCNASLKVQKIEDVRTSKRQFIVNRAKELLKTLTDEGMPDSQELAEEVSQSVRIEEITTWGPERIPAGPAIDESEEVIFVEGRADVLTLLRHGIKNAIAVNGTQIPASIGDLSRSKTVTVFVDGDRGGDIIIQELLAVAEIDFVTKAPDGKEVEELTKKEIHKALRARIAAEQIKAEMPPTDRNRERLAVRERQREERQDSRGPRDERQEMRGPRDDRRGPRDERAPRDDRRGPRDERAPRDERRGPREERSPREATIATEKQVVTQKEKDMFRSMLEDLIGTRAGYVLDEKLQILGKVPLSEIVPTVKSLQNVYAVVLDGNIERDLVQTCERLGTRFLAGMGIKAESSNITLLSVETLE
jgi:DNA primase